MGSYAYCKEMRRSLYQRTFLKKSTLYRNDHQRRPSTLPPHVQPTVPVPMPPQVPLKTKCLSLSVPMGPRPETRTRCPPPRLSCSEAAAMVSPVDVTVRRPYRSAEDDLTSDFPLRIKTDLSADTLRRSQDSGSSGSYLSPRSHYSISNQAEEFEMDVFSRQSSETSDELQRRRQKRSERLLSFQEARKRDSTDTTDETWKTCASAGEGSKSEPVSESSQFDYKLKETISWEDSVESEGSFSQSVIDVSKGEGYDFALKQFESYENPDLYEKPADEHKEQVHSNKTKSEFLRLGLFEWNKSYCDDFDVENIASNREEAAIAFKIDVYSEQSERDPDSPTELNKRFSGSRGLFPGKRMLPEAGVIAPGVAGSEGDMDEGFDSPVYSSRDTDELGDLFASRQELARREAFRKERSLDSDETSGFISKHSSETTDLSSRLSSTQFTTKHLSEPLGFWSAGTPSEMPRQQHLSEPSDMPLHLATPTGLLPPLPDSDFSSGRLLSVDSEAESKLPGAMSKRREHFRKSKRLKHFNLRRIDDTDNDSSYDSEKPQPSSEEAPEPPSTRLKEEVGLPKHLSRDSSVDRYGLYKSRSEKTITSFESDRGQGRLHDFESFCEAVNFTRLADMKQRAASAEEMEMSDMDGALEPRTPPLQLCRKARSKRDLTRRLKCLLL